MSKKSAILVALQFTAFGILLFNSAPLAKGFWFVIQVIGFLLAFWATLNLGIGNFNIQPEVKNRAIFKTQGIYNYIRNPIYLGLLIYFMAIIISDFSWLSFITLLLLIVVLILKINMEEVFLTEKFKDNYIQYKKKTKRLIPFIY